MPAQEKDRKSKDKAGSTLRPETEQARLPSGVTVLPSTVADVPEIHAIEKDSFPSPWPEKVFLRALRSKWVRFYTAFSEGRVVGYAAVRLGYSAHVLNIAVHRDHRRRKIGSLLISHLINVAARHKASCVTLEVRASNRAAQMMYFKFGFAPIALERMYYAREKEDAILMEKRMPQETIVSSRATTACGAD